MQFYCLLVPICVLTPEVVVPYWALVYVPMLVVLSTVFFTPRGWAYAAHFVLFENAMSVVKISAMVAGLLELSSAHEWVVTLKQVLMSESSNYRSVPYERGQIKGPGTSAGRQRDQRGQTKGPARADKGTSAGRQRDAPEC